MLVKYGTKKNTASIQVVLDYRTELTPIICRSVKPRPDQWHSPQVWLYLGYHLSLNSNNDPQVCQSQVRLKQIQTMFRHADVKCKWKQGCYIDIWLTLTSGVFIIITASNLQSFLFTPILDISPCSKKKQTKKTSTLVSGGKAGHG